MKYEDPQSWLEKFSARVNEYLDINSTAKQKMSGGAAIINKCDLLSEEEL
jgi:hypothetical protein